LKENKSSEIFANLKKRLGDDQILQQILDAYAVFRLWEIDYTERTEYSKSSND
jgi:hypothetical protein